MTVPHRTFLRTAREEFHASLLESLLTLEGGVPSNADGSRSQSVAIASGIAKRLKARAKTKTVAQTSGNAFEELVARFVRTTLANLGHGPSPFLEVRQIPSHSRLEIAKYAQYRHLADLDRIAKQNPELAAMLGNDYTISPDIVIIRHLMSDEQINADQPWVDEIVAKRSSLRQGDGKVPLLHASISTKWTLRSDRAQNARSEALTLIRNRKGRQPHIVVVTGEPLPSRISSLALGTGDIDCVYHFALDELIAAVDENGNEEARSQLALMVNGKRLKDISDLPLDLLA